MTLRVVCLADTHGRHDELVVPDGDMLIHAGDFTSRGTLGEVADALRWLAALPHRHKLVVAGNHEFAFEQSPRVARGLVPPGITYLEGEPAIVEDLVVWGGPWVPLHAHWAFEANPLELRGHWASIPDDTAILITHTPAAGTLDQYDFRGPLGCPLLARRLAELSGLKLHVHGHIHAARGMVPILGRRAVAVNAAQLTGGPPRALQPPLVVEL